MDRKGKIGCAPVLVVEDDEALGELFVTLVETRGYRAKLVGRVADALAQLHSGERFSVVVTDLRLPDGEGFSVIEAAKQADPRTAVIFVTAFGSIETAVRAVRLGAYDFLTKPVEPTVFGVALDRAVEAQSLRSEVQALRSALGPLELHGLVGRSPALADILSLLRRIADSDATVLITGPSGSGKERVAKALHAMGDRKDKPFVAVNAAAIPDALLESELFGHVKGAFTDAKRDKKGLVAEADGGILFLDEIGDLSPVLQAKLLRMLQEREVRPVGATKSTPVDIRVLSATHHDLRALVKDGRFREDLFYRLAVIEVAIPPLRDRPEDILPLAEYFLAGACARAKRSIKGFSGAAAKLLLSYAWPGNVRELSNAVERAVALSQDEWISPDDLPPTLKKPAEADLFVSAAERMLTLDELSRGYVLHVLERFGGNKVRAAAALGISRRTIQRWLGESSADE